METLAGPEWVDLLKAATWFLCGVVCHRFLAALLGYGRVAIFAQEMNDSVLKLVGSVVEDLAFARELKYKTIKESGLEDTQLELIKSVDSQLTESWKRDLINRFLNAYPKRYYHLIQFSDWDEAMARLTELYKKNS